MSFYPLMGYSVHTNVPGPIMILAMLVFSLLAYACNEVKDESMRIRKSGEGESCTDNTDCKNALKCAKGTCVLTRSSEGPGKYCSRTADCRNDLKCYDNICVLAIGSVGCRKKKAYDCLEKGLCTSLTPCKRWHDNRNWRLSCDCIAKFNEDCQRSENCKFYGLCTASKGKCIAGSDSDCRKSKICMEHKHCFATNEECEEKKDVK